ncbi:MAG: hypothetical protein ABFD25_18180 [Clostridiaceae bacterium]
MNFLKRPVFYTGIAVLISLIASAIWLKDSIANYTGDEKDLLRKLDFNENEITPDTEPSGAMKNDLTGIAYNGSNMYVAVDSAGKIFTSTDSIKWTDRQSGANVRFRGIAWGGEQFVAVGDEGAILSSEDGISWIRRDSGMNADFCDVIWDDRCFMALGNRTIMSSADGAVWTEGKTPDPAQGSDAEDKIPYYFSDILWDGKQYIASGGGNFILTSEDLYKWTVREPNSMGTGMFCDMAYSGKQYAAVGDHLAIMASSDGYDWTDKSQIINQIDSVDDFYTLCLQSVEWGKDKFIAVGHRGLILASADGLEWSVAAPVTRQALNQVIWDGKQFIAVGNNGTIITSVDGLDWECVSHV